MSQIKPNIIFILIDDMGWKDLACYGSSFYETPVLDRMASEGMLFTDAYASCPVCSPTRASALTGKYPARVGITNYIDWGGKHHPSKGKLIDVPYLKEMPLEEVTIAKGLKDAGYHTWHVGKWHLGGEGHYPDNYGFDVNIGGCEWGMPCKGYFSPYGIKNLEEGPEGEYLTDRITDEAIQLIKNNDGKPFFLNLWHYSVHTPIQGKAADVERFRKKAEALGLDKMEALVEGENYPNEHKKHLKVTRRTLQSDPAYAAMVYNLDWNIGRLLQALEETGQAQNTLVVFTSDNGGLSTAEGSPTCNAPLSEGKGWMYDGGVREPLIVKWTGVIAPGSLCSTPVTTPDFYPTFLEVAGIPLIPEQHVDGVSLMSLLKGENSLDREAIYWHYPHYGNQGGTPGCSMRMGDYKLIEFFEDGRLELYNLIDDIQEKDNLAEKMPALTKRMQQMLIAWRESIEAKIPQPNPDWDIYRQCTK